MTFTKTSTRLFVFILLFSCLSLCAQVNQDGDYQIWFYQSVDKEFTETFTTRFQTEFRWGDDVSTLYFKYAEVNLIYKPQRYLHIAPGYRHLFVRSPASSMKWSQVYNPLVDITFLGHVKNLRIKQRNRIQYRIFEEGRNRWLYRSRFRFFSPWMWTELNINPYVGGEFFWQEGLGIDQTRVTAGTLFNIHERLKLNFFYTMRYLKAGGEWPRQNVFGAHLYLYF